MRPTWAMRMRITRHWAPFQERYRVGSANRTSHFAGRGYDAVGLPNGYQAQHGQWRAFPTAVEAGSPCRSSG